MLTGPSAAPEHLDGERARARLSLVLDREVPSHLVDALTGPARADAPDAADAFGIERTPLAEAMRAALAPATAEAPDDR
jgi:hypothetical protein